MQFFGFPPTLNVFDHAALALGMSSIADTASRLKCAMRCRSEVCRLASTRTESRTRDIWAGVSQGFTMASA